MKIIKAYTKGFGRTLSSYKMVSVIYFITLILGLTITIPFRNTLKKAIGHSLIPEKLLYGFNFTIFEDFIRNNGKVMLPFLQIIFWVGIVYLLFTVFFAGGILNIFYNERNKFSMQSFFEGCGKYFLRFFRLMIFTFLLNFIFILITYLPLGLIFSFLENSHLSERTLFYIGSAGVLFHFFLIGLSLIISDYAKIEIVINDTQKVFKTFWQSVKFTIKHFFEVYALYLMLLIFPFLLFAIYYYIDKSFTMTSAKTILSMFLIQQIIIWLKLFSKVWFYKSELSYYKNHIKDKQEEGKEFLDLKDMINPHEI